MTIKIDDFTKRSFVRDYKLPIQIVEEPYFSYYIDLYEPDYKSRTLYDNFIKTIYSFGSTEAFFKHSKNVREKSSDYIKSLPDYQSFCNDTLVNFNSKSNINKGNLYNQSNVLKTFVSIDLVSANLQSFNFYNKDIFKSDNYRDFITQFTDCEYIINSKSIRQLIFGTLEPKKQQRIQKFIMNNVADSLFNVGLDKNHIASSSPDEIIFELKHLNNFKDFLKDKSLRDLKFHIDVFTLNNIKNDIPVFIKTFHSKDGFDIKGCNNKNMAEVYKYLKSLPLHQYDRLFMDEGRIAEYKYPFIT